MAIVTGQQLIDRIRQRSDQVNSGFVTDSEILNLATVYKRELFDLLARTYGADYSATSTTFSATASTENYSLSALTTGTFYKALGVDVSDSSAPTGWRNVQQYNFADRNAGSAPAGYSSLPIRGDTRYRIFGDNLSLRPAPTGTATMKLWYVPQTTSVSDTTSSFDDVNGWSQLIVVNSAIAIKDKEESDTGELERERASIIQRITEMAPNRDAGEPQTVVDVGSRNIYPLWGGWQGW